MTRIWSLPHIWISRVTQGEPDTHRDGAYVIKFYTKKSTPCAGAQIVESYAELKCVWYHTHEWVKTHTHTSSLPPSVYIYTQCIYAYISIIHMCMHMHKCIYIQNMCIYTTRTVAFSQRQSEWETLYTCIHNTYVHIYTQYTCACIYTSAHICTIYTTRFVELELTQSNSMRKSVNTCTEYIYIHIYTKYICACMYSNVHIFTIHICIPCV